MFNDILKLGRQKLWVAYRNYLIEKHELKYLFWECTLNCNFKCAHCGSYAGENLYEETISTDEIKNAFMDIAQNFNAKEIRIAVTGGEPLLRKDVFEAMSYATSLGFQWGMISNGSLITGEVAKKAKASGAKTIDISIDGIEEIHDKFRNAKGSYAKAIKAIEYLTKANFLKMLRITTTVHANNFDSLDQMYDIFSTLGISDWRVFNVEPIGRTMGREDILLSKEQLLKLLGFIKAKRKKHGMKVTYGCAHFLGDEFEDEVRSNFFYCGTGINIGSILHNGDIFVCPNVLRLPDLIQGNIKHDSFSEIWNNKFKFFRNKDRTSCDACHKCNHWQECLGDSLHSWDFKKRQPKLCIINNG